MKHNSPYRITDDTVTAPATEPREPIQWARVGGAIIIVSALAFSVTLMSMVLLTAGTEVAVPHILRWLSVACCALFASGLTLALVSHGEVFPSIQR